MRKSKGHVLAVVGAQYGSEGKGVIVNYLAIAIMSTYALAVPTLATPSSIRAGSGRCKSSPVAGPILRRSWSWAGGCW